MNQRRKLTKDERLVDDLKANRKKINLWHDQLIHMSQIAVTAIVMLF